MNGVDFVPGTWISTERKDGKGTGSRSEMCVSMTAASLPAQSLPTEGWTLGLDSQD